MKISCSKCMPSTRDLKYFVQNTATTKTNFRVPAKARGSIPSYRKSSSFSVRTEKMNPKSITCTESSGMPNRSEQYSKRRNSTSIPGNEYQKKADLETDPIFYLFNKLLQKQIKSEKSYPHLLLHKASWLSFLVAFTIHINTIFEYIVKNRLSFYTVRKRLLLIIYIWLHYHTTPD